MLRSLSDFLLVVLTLACFLTSASAADIESASPKPAGTGAKRKVELTQVEMFSAMESGEIEVTFIPKDATEATVLFRNKTGKPVAIKLPDAFAGVPVLAQFGMGGCGGMGGMGMGMGGMQGMGGGMGGMMGGMGMGGMGGMGMGGFMNVAADKVGKLKVPLVCLEHGKKDPNPRVKYEIKPIETFTENQRVAEICKMLGRREIPQNAAQAAAWNLANGVSWNELASKDRVRLLNGYTEKFFSPDELGLATRIVEEAARRASSRPERTRTSQ